MKRTISTSMFYNATPQIFDFAKRLRKNMTQAELLLWNRLSNNALNVRFKSQHPIERFIADFYCHQFKLVIEVDGGIHNNQQEYDIGRSVELEKYGIKVIRFTNDEVINNLDNVVERIKMFLPLNPIKGT